MWTLKETQPQQQSPCIYLAVKERAEINTPSKEFRLIIIVLQIKKVTAYRGKGILQLITNVYKSHICSTSTICLESRRDADIHVSRKAKVNSLCD